MKKYFALIAVSATLLTACGSSIDSAAIEITKPTINTEIFVGDELTIPVEVNVINGEQYEVFVSLQRFENGKWKNLTELKAVTAPVNTNFEYSVEDDGDFKYRVAVWDSTEAEQPLSFSSETNVTSYDVALLRNQISEAYINYLDVDTTYWEALDSCYSLPGTKGNTDTFKECYPAVRRTLTNYIDAGWTAGEVLGEIKVPEEIAKSLDDFVGSIETASNEYQYVLDSFCHSRADEYAYIDDLYACVNTLDSKGKAAYRRIDVAFNIEEKSRDALGRFFESYGLEPDIREEQTSA